MKGWAAACYKKTTQKFSEAELLLFFPLRISSLKYTIEN
jgi:hypothetical protein